LGSFCQNHENATALDGVAPAALRRLARGKTEKQPHAKCGARTVRVLLHASCLFLLLCPLTLAKPHAWSTAVFVNEFDAGVF
jgi:hypothetical protein